MQFSGMPCDSKEPATGSQAAHLAARAPPPPAPLLPEPIVVVRTHRPLVDNGAVDVAHAALRLCPGVVNDEGKAAGRLLVLVQAHDHGLNVAHLRAATAGSGLGAGQLLGRLHHGNKGAWQQMPWAHVGCGTTPNRLSEHRWGTAGEISQQYGHSGSLRGSC